MIVAWLNAQYATQGWGFLQTDSSTHETYQQSAEGVSALWRGTYNPGWLPPYDEATLSALQRAAMPGWLVDRFDSFIYTLKQNTAADKEKKTPAEWWVQFYPYDEFENEIIWYAKNR